LQTYRVTVSDVPFVSVSEAVLVNNTASPSEIRPAVLETDENVGTWFTAKGEPELPEPCEAEEHKEAALWSQTKAYQSLLSESPERVV
jgi:hypothetical protein